MYPCAHGSDEKYHPRWRRSTAPPIKALSVKKSIELIFAQLDIFGLLLPWANSCQELLKVAKKWKELWIVYRQFAKIPWMQNNFEAPVWLSSAALHGVIWDWVDSIVKEITSGSQNFQETGQFCQPIFQGWNSIMAFFWIGFFWFCIDFF